MKTITIVELNDIDGFPPVQNLIRLLLNRGYRVNLIGCNLTKIPENIRKNKNYIEHNLTKRFKSESLIGAIINRIFITIEARKCVSDSIVFSDYLWTTSMKTVQILGKIILNHPKNILQLMELAEHGYYFREYFKFPIEKYARKSWKTVVPEINRAYIQKIWWNLPQTPKVLPNKPYSIEYGEITEDLKTAIDIISKEKKKIVLYLGIIGSDRNLEECAKAMSNSDKYKLYIVGRAYSSTAKTLIEHLKEKYDVIYLGGFIPPKHLTLIKFARVGLLPYKPAKLTGYSDLNALYCAPNKIFEYAGFGVPMVGSDVLGLKLPFEQWNIGRCCDLDDENSIIRAIEEVDKNHDEMSKNCYKFYDSVDLDKIVSEILED